MSFLKKHKFDLILILAVIVIAGGFWLVRALTRTPGGRVEVIRDGQVVMALPLEEDAVLPLGEGAHTNTLVIEDGMARVTAASCPDRVCMDRGVIRYDGETIVCLPNDLIVRISGGQSAGLDGVSQ